MGRRWSRSSRRYLIASGVLSLLTALLVRSYLSRLAEAAEREVLGRAAPVVVAGEEIERGTVVGESQLRVQTLPVEFRPPGSFDRISQAAGRVALAGLAPGEVVTQTRLARVRAGPVASLVPQGLRAFAVPTSLPPGAVAAGDHVDVLATFGSGQPYTETVVRDVEVLLVMGETPPSFGGGTELQLDASASGASGTVTLIVLVSPDQQEELAFARAFADLAVTIAAAEQGGEA